MTTTFPTSKFDEAVNARVREIAAGVKQTVSLPGGEYKTDSKQDKRAETASSPVADRPQTNSLRYGIKLNPLGFELKPSGIEYKYVNLILNREQRYADLTVHGPEANLPTDVDEIQKLGDAYWPLQAFRELDHALLHLRVNEPEIGLVCIRTKGNSPDVLAVDKLLAENQDHWLIREIVLNMARVLRRLDLTAKSFFAIVEPDSCFAGSLLELLLASDRSYMLNNPDAPATLSVSELNARRLADEQRPDAPAVALPGDAGKIRRGA